MAETRIGIIGFGKIAQDQHVPAITGNSAFRLVAVVDPGGAQNAPVPIFPDHHRMLAEVELDAVAICTPAGPRHDIARDCLKAGKDVLLEKPPSATIGGVADLDALNRGQARVLFTTWHAQYNSTVDKAVGLVRREGLRSLRVEWLEDVEKWHPGQQWIWQPGGFGVFDAGINALSIATAISPTPLMIDKADFVLHEAGQQPIAADLSLKADGVDGQMSATLDWRHKGDEHWTIAGETAAGTHFLLASGGATLQIGDGAVEKSATSEYPAIYQRFAELIQKRTSLVDWEPLRLVADAFLLAGRS